VAVENADPEFRCSGRVQNALLYLSLSHTSKILSFNYSALPKVTTTTTTMMMMIIIIIIIIIINGNVNAQNHSLQMIEIESKNSYPIYLVI
jgi:hypothetical protein